MAFKRLFTLLTLVLAALMGAVLPLVGATSPGGRRGLKKRGSGANLAKLFAEECAKACQEWCYQGEDRLIKNCVPDCIERGGRIPRCRSKPRLDEELEQDQEVQP